MKTVATKIQYFILFPFGIPIAYYRRSPVNNPIVQVSIDGIFAEASRRNFVPKPDLVNTGL